MFQAVLAQMNKKQFADNPSIRFEQTRINDNVYSTAQVRQK